MKRGMSVEEEQRLYFRGVFAWMFLGLLVSAIASFVVISNVQLANLILGTPLFWVILIAELLLVVALAGFIRKVSATTATVLFILYSLFTGLTLAVIFLAYTLGSIILVFLLAAGIFGAMALWGFITKTDLSKLGTLFIFALLGIIVASVVNLWLQNSMADLVLSVLAIIVFMGLTAYDVQRLKRINVIGNHGTSENHKETIIGALTLYLDFINLFLNLLRLMGKRR